MDKQTLFKLLDKYKDGTASPAEKTLLEAYYQRLQTAENTALSADEEKALKETIYAQVAAGIRHQEAKIIQVKRKRFLWTAAAAAVLLALGGSYYLFFTTRPTKQQQAPLAQQKPCDLPPGRNAATLTLADGKTIVLDSSSGTISTQGGVTVINMSGLLSYASSQKAIADQPVYNTVTTARGNQYQLVLADGSKVWLNSASSLRFPTAFTGPSREVELNGEGYFEVAEDPSQPFIVAIGAGSRVEVLGTHFNVNCYPDEESVRTTLLEGKVKVVNRQSVVLKPGEQAILTHDSRLTIHDNIDIDQVMAWKNGWFEFDNTDLRTIMRQISRWYDVDIVYSRKQGNEKFGGRISKTENLSTILKALESEELQFRLEGKKLIIQ